VSYWTNEAAIRAWREQVEHCVAQEQGRSKWDAQYELRVARVERAYGKRDS
jgi:heme-degrading monooxygenase HmoA